MLTIKDIQDLVSEVAGNYPVKKIELFGSYAEGNNKENSDIDLLVEFTSPFTSLITISGLKIGLEETLNKEVDLITLPINENSILKLGKVIPIYET